MTRLKVQRESSHLRWERVVLTGLPDGQVIYGPPVGPTDISSSSSRQKKNHFIQCSVIHNSWLPDFLSLPFYFRGCRSFKKYHFQKSISFFYLTKIEKSIFFSWWIFSWASGLSFICCGKYVWLRAGLRSTRWNFHSSFLGFLGTLFSNCTFFNHLTQFYN